MYIYSYPLIKSLKTTINLILTSSASNSLCLHPPPFCAYNDYMDILRKMIPIPYSRRRRYELLKITSILYVNILVIIILNRVITANISCM